MFYIYKKYINIEVYFNLKKTFLKRLVKKKKFAKSNYVSIVFFHFNNALFLFFFFIIARITWASCVVINFIRKLNKTVYVHA